MKESVNNTVLKSLKVLFLKSPTRIIIFAFVLVFTKSPQRKHNNSNKTIKIL